MSKREKINCYDAKWRLENAVTDVEGIFKAIEFLWYESVSHGHPDHISAMTRLIEALGMHIKVLEMHWSAASSPSNEKFEKTSKQAYRITHSIDVALEQ